MKVFDYIKKHTHSINSLYMLGIVSSKTITYFEIYQFYLDALALGSKQAAIAFAQDNFDTTIARVYRAIELMESEM